MPSWEFERKGKLVKVDPAGPLVVTADAAGVPVRRLAASGPDGGVLEPVLQDWCHSFPGPFLYYLSRQHMPAHCVRSWTSSSTGRLERCCTVTCFYITQPLSRQAKQQNAAACGKPCVPSRTDPMDPMKAMKLAAVCGAGAGLLLSSTMACAGIAPYAGLSAVYSYLDDSDFKSTGVLVNARATFGVNLSPYFGAEIHGGIGVSGDSLVLKDPEEKVDVKLKSYTAIYAKGNLPVDPTMNVYALLGYAKIKADASVDGTSASSNQGDLSYGLGFDVKIARQARFMIDGIVLHDSGSLDIMTLSAGVQWDF